MKDPVYYIGDETDNRPFEISRELSTKPNGFIYTVYEVERETAEKLKELLKKIHEMQFEDIIKTMRTARCLESPVMVKVSVDSKQLAKEYMELRPEAPAGFFITNRRINQTGLIIEKGLLPNLSKTFTEVKSKMKN